MRRCSLASSLERHAIESDQISKVFLGLQGLAISDGRSLYQYKYRCGVNDTKYRSSKRDGNVTKYSNKAPPTVWLPVVFRIPVTTGNCSQR